MFIFASADKYLVDFQYIMNTEDDLMHLKQSGTPTLNWYYSKCKKWTLTGPSALNVCL